MLMYRPDKIGKEASNPDISTLPLSDMRRRPALYESLKHRRLKSNEQEQNMTRSTAKFCVNCASLCKGNRDPLLSRGSIRTVEGQCIASGCITLRWVSVTAIPVCGNGVQDGAHKNSASWSSAYSVFGSLLNLPAALR
jgi:hypothetical protein